jgi:hypothetical protein
MKTFLSRMIGAARLDSGTYEQVEADPASSGPAVLVVMSASVAAGLGSGITDPQGLIGVTLVALITWLVMVGLAIAALTIAYSATREMPVPPALAAQV